MNVFYQNKRLLIKETTRDLLAKFFNLIFVLVYFSHAHSFWLVSTFIHTLHLNLGFPNKMIKAKKVVTIHVIVYSLGIKKWKGTKWTSKGPNWHLLSVHFICGSHTSNKLCTYIYTYDDRTTHWIKIAQNTKIHCWLYVRSVMVHSTNMYSQYIFIWYNQGHYTG